MAPLQTVRGGIDPGTLGHSQIHEHIFVRPTPMAAANPALQIDNFDRSLSELRAYRQCGGHFLADAQPVAAGRDAEALLALSEQSGVHIAAVTGYHLLGFYADDCWIHALDEDALYTLYRSELKEGMLPWSGDPTGRPRQPTSIRAGLVKAAIPRDGPVGRYEVLLRAAARAAAWAGVPLMLHTEQGGNALAAIELCTSLGVPPYKLIVCHADRQATDFSPHDAIAATGVYLDYDTIARFKYHSDEEEVALIRHMLSGGYAGRILPALDTTAARLTAYGGETGLCYILETFLPMLRAAGISQEDLELMTVGNVRRLFSTGAIIE